MKKILGNLRKTIQENELIKENDKVAIGVSGGKDSMMLLYAMRKLQDFYPIKFEIAAFCVDLGMENFHSDSIKDFCDSIDVPLYIVKTQISKIVFEVRNEKNPCSLCAKMRRGALHKAAVAEGFKIIALGHHEDDAIETLFMNLIYTGRINTFMMDTYLSRMDIHVIRPLITTKEKDIIHAMKHLDIPIVKNPCPMDRTTKREETKNMLADFYKIYPGSRKNFATAISSSKDIQLIK